jgi:hypothetical protein
MFARIGLTAGRKSAPVYILIASFAIIWLLPLSAAAENKVTVESKWVEEGSTDVHLGIYLENDEPLQAFVIPLQIEMIHVGSFIRRTLKVIPQGRLAIWKDEELGQHTNYYPYRTPPREGRNTCTLDSNGNLWQWMSWDSLPDFMGEEALMYYIESTAFPPIDMMPGSDGQPGRDTASLLLVFDVTDVGGAFEIDTTCTGPANHITYVPSDIDRESHGIAPHFSKGIVLIGCNSECHGDPNCDGECNILDIISTVDVAFMGAPPIIDPDPRCPTEDSDVNCDMQTDVIDVIRMINVLYRSQSMADQFCQACDLAPKPGGPRKDPLTPYFRNGGD